MEDAVRSKLAGVTGQKLFTTPAGELSRNKKSLERDFPGLPPAMISALSTKIHSLLFDDDATRLLAEREHDHAELRAILEKAADEEGLKVVDPRDREGTDAGQADTPNDESKFHVATLTYGLAKDATRGIADFMCVDEEDLFVGMSDGIEGISREIEAYGTEVDKECLHYVLHEEAGSSDRTFQNGWKRDCDEHEGKRLPSREINGRGMTLEDFCKHPKATLCGLKPAHVLALRIYTTMVFMSINNPLRDVERKNKNEPHKLPLLVYWLSLAIKKMRTVAAASEEASNSKDFYRGMSNRDLLDQFMVEGGTELACMSTTADLRIALKYASRGKTAVLLRVRTSSCMQQGADLTWLSAFPHEVEFLYPPITFLRPIKRNADVFEIGNAVFKIVDVEPQLA
jgi:hypothetical protein